MESDASKRAKKKYYEKNKEKILKQQKEWRENNKDKFKALCKESRWRKVEKLREKGVTNAWDVVNKGVREKYTREKGYMLYDGE